MIRSIRAAKQAIVGLHVQVRDVMVVAVADCPREVFEVALRAGVHRGAHTAPVPVNDPAREVAEVSILKDQSTCERLIAHTCVAQEVDNVGVAAQLLQARGLDTTGVVQSFSALLVHPEIAEYLYCKAPLAFRVLRMEHPPP